MSEPLRNTMKGSCGKCWLFVWVWLLSGMPLFLHAQVQPAPTRPDTSKGKMILIDHFGKLIEDKGGIESIKWISQGLQLRIDSNNIYADSAVIFGGDRVHAFGNVVIQQPQGVAVFTDTLYYHRLTDIAELRGEVALEQETKQLWTPRLLYHLGERYGEYTNGGILVDESLQVSSRRGIYYATSERVHFKDSVVVLHPKFNLAADSMTYLAKEKRVLFTGPTNIFTPRAEIYCEAGYYDLQNETAEFNKNARYDDGEKNATSDTIRYMSASGEVLMLGNVLVDERTRRIEGNSLRYLERTGETWIYGQPARYADSTRTIISAEIFYNEKTNLVSTRGRGEISDGDLMLIADQFDFDQATGIGKATGQVLWSDTAQDFGIRADIIDYAKETQYVLAYGETRPVFYSLVEEDTLFIAADTLLMWNQTDTLGSGDTVRMITAYYDVRLYKSDMQGRADSLVFHGKDSLFTFFGDPVLWSDTTQFSADTIGMTLKDKQIESITLTRGALIISELYRVYYDQIKGKLIVAHFDSNAIREMFVTGNAESIYYTRDEQSAFIGVNQTICSKMHFTFRDGQIHILKYFGDNSSSMMPMSRTQHDQLRLEGFLWREDERPFSVMDLLK